MRPAEEGRTLERPALLIRGPAPLVAALRRPLAPSAAPDALLADSVLPAVAPAGDRGLEQRADRAGPAGAETEDATRHDTLAAIYLVHTTLRRLCCVDSL